MGLNDVKYFLMAYPDCIVSESSKDLCWVQDGQF
jgi:hypothetical protein